MNPFPNPSSPPRHRPSAAPARQRGVFAIALAAVALGVAGAMLGSHLLQRAQASARNVQGQADALRWADAAVRGYVLTHGHLPCPAAQPRGAEARNGDANRTCAQNKGWLPVASLVDVANADEPLESHLDIRYLAGRGGALARAQATFQPRLADGTALAGFPGGTGSPGLDFCARLQGAFNPLRRWGMAADAPFDPAVPVSGNAMVYGVAVAAHGASAALSGLNERFGDLRLESPLRARDTRYADRVRVVMPAAYFEAFGCGPLMASLDNMAVAQTWTEAAIGSRAGNIEVGQILGKIVLTATISDGLYLVDTVGGLANGIYNNASNILGIVKAILSWQFYRIPVHVKGIGWAIGGMAISAVDVARIAVALSLDATISHLYFQLSADAEALPVWTGAVNGVLQPAYQQGAAFHPSLPPAP